MTYTPVAKATVMSTSWQLLYDLLTTTLTDPIGRGNNDLWIKAAFPDIKKYENTWRFPIITIEPADFTFETLTIDRSKRKESIRFTLTIYAEAAAQIDLIADNIIDQLESARDTLRINGLSNFVLTGSGYDILLINANTKIHTKNLIIEFMRID